MSTLHFKNAVVYLGASSAAAAVLITEARSFELSIDRALEEDMSFGDDWQTQLSGVLSWTGSFEVNYDTAQATVFAAASAAGQAGRVPWYGYPTSASATRYYYGFVYVKLNGLGGGMTAVGRGTVDLTGDGQLSAN